MNLFYVDSDYVQNGHFVLTDQEAQHASKVLRLREGSKIYATDGKGNMYDGIIESLSKREVYVEIIRERSIPKGKELVLAMGILKKRTRLEFAVEKAVELGASKIVLFQSQHSERGQFKAGRLQMIIMSAMKQSMRAWLPVLEVYHSLEDTVDAYNDFYKVIAHEKADISEHADLDIEQSKYLLLIGPEGGFSDREVKYTLNEGGKMVSLGSYRLRAETAVITLMSKFVG